MKLRNKITGEIATLTLDSDGETLIIMKDDEIIVYGVSFEDLVQDWEDYEEPKEYWAIDCFVPDGDLVSQFSNCSESVIENRKSIGNYFSSREEAELAVRKLKAWKRLKDKGFKFVLCDDRVENGKLFIVAKMPILNIKESQNDLDSLFSGGEE